MTLDLVIGSVIEIETLITVGNSESNIVCLRLQSSCLYWWSGVDECIDLVLTRFIQSLMVTRSSSSSSTSFFFICPLKKSIKVLSSVEIGLGPTLFEHLPRRKTLFHHLWMGGRSASVESSQWQSLFYDLTNHKNLALFLNYSSNPRSPPFNNNNETDMIGLSTRQSFSFP